DAESIRPRQLPCVDPMSAAAYAAPLSYFPQHHQNGATAFGFYRHQAVPMPGQQYNSSASRQMALPCLATPEAYDALCANYLHFYRPMHHGADSRAVALNLETPKSSHS
ncbi:unnamed protein product, partial [Ixodes hexagonus]